MAWLVDHWPRKKKKKQKKIQQKDFWGRMKTWKRA